MILHVFKIDGLSGDLAVGIQVTVRPDLYEIPQLRETVESRARSQLLRDFPDVHNVQERWSEEEIPDTDE